MLNVCNHLIETIPDLSILMVSGSPMVHSFRMKSGIDYIKLPCLSRTTVESYSVKTIGVGLAEIVSLRSELILQTVKSFKPDLMLIDKKPYGVQHELRRALHFARTCLPDTKIVLLLRDILDSVDATTAVWKKHGYYEAIQRYYDRVLIVGLKEVFDTVKEYGFTHSVADKVRYCGYIKPPAPTRSLDEVRKELKLACDKIVDKLVLVTVGGGEDGCHLIDNYLHGLAAYSSEQSFDSLIVCGPEMAPLQRQTILQAAARHPRVQVREFVSDMMSYMNAADTVVSMAGYNTVCELLSLGKPTVLVPRVQPVMEQWIRAQRMANLGCFRVLRPDVMTPTNLMHAVIELSQPGRLASSVQPRFDFSALPRVRKNINALLRESDHAELGDEIDTFQEDCFA